MDIKDTDLSQRVKQIKELDLLFDNRTTTDREALVKIKQTSEVHMQDALADDMEGYVRIYQKRIALIVSLLNEDEKII